MCRTIEEALKHPFTVKDFVRPEFREWFATVDLVVAKDKTVRDHTTLFYGVAELESFLERAKVNPSERWEASVAVIEIDFSDQTDELEYLVAACRVLKKRCEYKADSEKLDVEQLEKDIQAWLKGKK